MAKKTSGISAVYSSVTGTVVTVASSLDVLASAGNQLAKNAEVQAMISRIESSNSLLEAMGIDMSNKDPSQRLADASAIMTALRTM